MLQTQGASYGNRPMNILCISQAPTQAKGFTQFSVMSPSYRGNGLSFGGIGSLDDIIETFRLHVVGGGKDLYGTTKHKRVQPLLRLVVYGLRMAKLPAIDFLQIGSLYDIINVNRHHINHCSGFKYSYVYI